MYSCPKCSLTTKYKANLERHTPKCKGEKSLPIMYSCEVCSTYTTTNKAHLERHQESELCKRKASAEMTVEQRLQYLEKTVEKILDILEKRPKTKEEIKQEDEKKKQSIKRDLTKHGILFDVHETLAGLRHLRQTQIYDKLNQKL